MGFVVLLAFGIWHLPFASNPVFATPAGVVLNQVNPAKTADFELVVKRLRTALLASPDPERRKQALGWKVYKAAEPYKDSTLYVFVLDPAIAGADYSITRTLADVAPADVQTLYEKFSGACTAQTFLAVTPVTAGTGSERQ
jgi:hypothetical protein